jgi:hypothetical protein
MKKEINQKKRVARRSSSRINWRATALLSTFFILVCGFGIFFYQSPTVLSYKERLHTWIAEHKGQVHQGLVKVKQLAAKKSDESAEPHIHFEFYTALPNMQTSVPELAVAKPVFKAEELEREFSEQIKRKT